MPNPNTPTVPVPRDVAERLLEYLRIESELSQRRDDLVNMAEDHVSALSSALAAPTTEQSSAVQQPTLDSLAAEIREWQNVTFPQATPASASKHLLKEAHELVAAPTDPEEMADILLLIIGVANKAGVDLVEAAAAKLAKNKARKWGPVNAEGFVEHVRTPEESASSALAAPADTRLQDSYDHFNLAIQDLPNDKGLYAHLLVCSADRRKPAGTPGIGCVCHPKLRAYMLAAPAASEWEYDLSKAPVGAHIEVSYEGMPGLRRTDAILNADGRFYFFGGGGSRVLNVYAWRPLPAPAPKPEGGR